MVSVKAKLLVFAPQKWSKLRQRSPLSACLLPSSCISTCASESIPGSLEGMLGPLKTLCLAQSSTLPSQTEMCMSSSWFRLLPSKDSHPQLATPWSMTLLVKLLTRLSFWPTRCATPTTTSPVQSRNQLLSDMPTDLLHSLEREEEKERSHLNHTANLKPRILPSTTFESVELTWMSLLDYYSSF